MRLAFQYDCTTLCIYNIITIYLWVLSIYRWRNLSRAGAFLFVEVPEVIFHVCQWQMLDLLTPPTCVTDQEGFYDMDTAFTFAILPLWIPQVSLLSMWISAPGVIFPNVNISPRCHCSQCEYQPQISLLPLWTSAPGVIVPYVNIIPRSHYCHCEHQPRCHCSECEHQPQVSLFPLWTSAPGVIVPTVDINPRFPCYHWISTLGFPVIIGYQPLVSLLSLDINPRFPCCHCGYQP